MKRTSSRIFETQDGSHSVYSETYGVSYHSKYGAIQESQHVFIESGLYYKMAGSTAPISILEIGMGTGLNVFMTMLEAEKRQVHISYTTVEAYPLPMDEASQLNYPQQLDKKEWTDRFTAIHECKWNKLCRISPYFELKKLQTKFEELDLVNSFDVIYFDAFAPNAQPELWDEHVMGIMYRALKPEGVLTTYCAKGAVKRTLRGLGFTIQALPGPPGKREMTRAVKS
ncbi:MAG: tRNA (5-methylaminomethyl-2-thiouridine)(34)-methyltransferase MnmD [Saprospiraceae bacterium]